MKHAYASTIHIVYNNTKVKKQQTFSTMSYDILKTSQPRFLIGESYLSQG